jgi:CBS-domain-containing membrane protein
MKPDGSKWLWLAYAAVFVPVIGQAAVVVASSLLYYRWRRAWPKEALRLNVHAWIAVALHVALMALVRR